MGSNTTNTYNNKSPGTELEWNSLHDMRKRELKICIIGLGIIDVKIKSSHGPLNGTSTCALIGYLFYSHLADLYYVAEAVGPVCSMASGPACHTIQVYISFTNLI